MSGNARHRALQCDSFAWLLLLLSQVGVQKASGEYGVDSRPFLPARFAYSPIMTALENNVGSVQGGRLLKLTSPAAAFNATHPAKNRVRHYATSYARSCVVLLMCTWL